MKQGIGKWLALLSMTFMVSACGNMEKRPLSGNEQGSVIAIGNDNLISDAGTVRFNDVEGGHFVIVADEDGATYLPTQLPMELQTDGLRVVFEGKLARDSYMNQMSGQILTINSIVLE